MYSSAICVALLFLKMYPKEKEKKKKKILKRKKYFYVKTEEVTLGIAVD